MPQELAFKEHRTLTERLVPKPVRKLFRWMNLHFKEDGRLIYKMAQTLPEEQKKEVIEQGKDLMTARAKKNFPRGVRNVITGLVVAQGMWYLGCRYLETIPAVRDSSVGWLFWGGSDKLFIASDQHLYDTGGHNARMMAHIASMIPRTALFGMLTLGAELTTDYIRSYGIEYWTQKRYGLVCDGAARAYGQVRPFPFRYSTIETYQKIASYIMRPWTVGSSDQIYSSVFGAIGSTWRTVPNVILMLTVGRAFDWFLKKVSVWTGLHKVAERIVEKAGVKEKQCLDAIEKAVGTERFTALKLQIAAESKTFMKWNPFKPAISWDAAERAASVVTDYRGLDPILASCADQESFLEASKKLRVGLGECAGRLEAIYGAKKIRKLAPSFRGFVDAAESEKWKSADLEGLRAYNALLGQVIAELQAEHSLS
jgi:hypothetical protein